MKKYILSFIALSTIMLSACSDNEPKNNAEENGNYIEFTLTNSSSRTIYDDQDDRTTSVEEWQINWENNDPIRIYCAEAKTPNQSDNADAPYIVTGINSGSDNQYLNDAKIQKVNANGLQWGTADKHDFFAVFPDDGKKIKSFDHAEKIVTFNFSSRQVIKEVKNNIATPDMNYAYMVAATQNVKKGDTVSLEFNPIMTTLEFNVKGLTNTSTIITGISIITTFEAGESVITEDGTFSYDIVSEKIIPIENSQASTQTIYVEMPTGGVTLSGDQTLNVTAFIPPVALTSENTKIQIHSTTETGASGTIGLSRLTLPKEITPSHKKILNLPNLPSPITNNWLTPLDNNIYVSQLSIPGTHDSCTGYGTDMGYATIYGLDWASDIINNIIGDPGLTQALTIEEQWDLGIRAFDFRPAYSTKANNFIIWHGLVVCHDGENPIYFETEINKLLDKMNGTEEFAVVLLRHEDETASVKSRNFTAKNTDKWTSSDSDAFPTLISSMLNSGKAVMWNPELTLGEVAGKIVFLCRDWTKYTEDNSKIVGAYTSWGHAKAGITGSIYNATGNNIFYLQDWYAENASGSDSTTDYLSDKVTAVKTYLDIAAELNNDNIYPDNSKLPWVVNHCSGYTGTSSSTSGYQENAASTNYETYQYLTGSQKKEGPTGIILMDYVGARKFGTTVYGDLCPQAIIDNNYKLVLKRKTSN